MTDVMMIQQSGSAGKYNGAGQQPSNVYGHQVVTSSSSSSSSCEETESVCSENDKLNSHKEDSDLDDYDKLRGGGDQLMDDDCDEDSASVSSKTHSTCSSSKPSASSSGAENMTGGNRRKQNKPIRIQEDQEKELLKQKAALAQSQAELESNPSSQQEEQVGSVTKHEPNPNKPKQDPRITARIADLIIHNKLDQIASAKIPFNTPAANTINSNNSHPDSLAKSPKVNPMETFCTICKKEVCNKYFLKTHLLNKHNVQIEDYIAMLQNMPTAGKKPNASSTGSLSSASSSSSSSSTSSIYENALEQQMHLTQKLLSQAKKQTGDNDLKVSPSKQLAALASMLQASKPLTGDNEDSSDNYSAYPEANPDTEALLSTILNMNKGTKSGQAANSQQSELFNHYFNIAMRQQQGMDMMNTLDTSGLNMSQAGGNNLNGSMNTSSTTQDFCDICQKQFCNKYYLKKHRMDVHGVSDNKSTPQANKRTPLATDPSKDLTQILMNQLNPLMQMANAQLAAVQSPSPSMSSASSSSLASSASANKDKKHDTALTSVTQDIKNEPDQLGAQNISVLNKIESTSEVSCPQCAKVFYNTEFLALHMQNKHGVVKTPAANTNSDKENASLMDATSQKISQLNTNSPAMHVNNAANKSAHESPLLQNQPFCEYCNKSFCNKYFLKTHMQKAHGKTLIIENNRTDEEQMDPNSEAHFASKVVDRVVCDICNKQVCNKYFLRTHKMRVHGLNPRNRSYFSANNNSQNVGDNTGNKGDLNGSGSAQMMANGQFCQDQDQDVPNEYNDGEDYEYDEEEMGALEDGEEGEFMGHKSRMNDSSEVGDGAELGEKTADVTSASAGKEGVRGRRGSTCSNLSIMTTSSTHNANEGLSMVNSAIKAAKELTNFGGYNNGASPISSTSSFSLNSPSSNDLSRRKGSQMEAFCNLCKRQFCSKYFLKQHMEKRHGLDMTSELADQTQFSESEEQSADMSELAMDNSHHTNNNSSLPLQHESSVSESGGGGAMSRVSCLICMKEVCNKYFLRQHVNQRHKMSFEEYTEKYGQTFGRKRQSTNPSISHANSSIPINNNQTAHYYNQHQEKLNKILLKNIKRGKSGMDTSMSEPKRKRKYSGSSSGNESYDTLSSSSNNFQQSMEHQQNKKSRAQNYEEEENMFSQQLMTLTSAAEAQGFTELQAFVIENEDGEFNENFRPSMIYLPVKSRLTDSLCLRVRLRPAIANNAHVDQDQDQEAMTEEDVNNADQMDNTLDNNHVNSLNNLEDDDEVAVVEECVEDGGDGLLDNSELRIAQSLECDE